MNEWKEIKLRELIDIKHGWPFKSTFFSDDLSGLPIVVGVGNFKYTGGFRFNETKLKTYTGDYPKEYELEPGDILLIMTCQTEGGEILGIPGMIPNDGKIYLHNQRLGKVIIEKTNRIDKSFLYWHFLTDNFNQELFLSSTGTKILHTSPERILSCSIKLPSIPEQKAIASVLNCLDDKINLLYHQNATLEAIAETLFRQWFVVEAKEGWEAKSLSSIANFLNGLACQKYPPKNDIEKLPVLKIKELSNGGISENSDWATTDVKPEYIVKNGNIIFAWSASLMVKIWNGQDCILNQHLFKVTSENFPKWFYYLWCKHHLAEFLSIAASHATTMGHIKRRDLDEAMVLVPSNTELEKMTKSIEPIIDKIIINDRQILTLTALRDTLLPKLMSGEVRVKDIEDGQTRFMAFSKEQASVQPPQLSLFPQKNG